MNSNELKQIRLKLNLTQAQLADLLGVSLSAVRSWEQGQRNISEPTARLAAGLAKVAVTAG